MSEKYISELTGKEYSLKNCVRIVNPLQCMFYWLSGLLPIDIYPSIDYKSGKPILVFIYDRQESKELYERWCEHDVNWETLLND